MIKKMLAIFFLTFLYVIFRYAIFGTVSFIHTPTLLLNKSVAWSSVIFLSLFVYKHLKMRKEQAKFWGKMSWQTAIIHVLLSLSIISKAYYSKFFGSDNTLNITGEITILFGVLSAYTFLLLKPNPFSSTPKEKLLILSSVFISIHLLAMGIKGWIHIEKWYGYMPPISLLGFVFTIISLFLLLRQHYRCK